MKRARKMKARLFLAIAAFLVCIMAACIITGCKTEPEPETEPPVEKQELQTDLNKYQFRSVWVSTISNLDFNRSSSENTFRNNYNNVLNTFANWNANAVIFQVSPLLDAYWPSQHRPWSQFLSSNRQGVHNAGYDALKIMVDLTHERGLEYHAWINPYRVTSAEYTDTSLRNANVTQAEADAMTDQQLIAILRQLETLSDDNYVVKNPAHVYRFNRRLYLDPGYPQARQHIIDTVTEIIENYDVDAVHIDDYFYPYSMTSSAGNMSADQMSFNAHGDEFSNDLSGREAWRRNNNDLLVQALRAVIDEHNAANGKTVQFGISPFGIWANNNANGHPEGSATTGNQSYRGGVYADTKKWVEEEWCDYMAPQIYWSFERAAAKYDVLAAWWANIHKNKNVSLYIGHANYKHLSSAYGDGVIETGFWNNPNQIPEQLEFNKDYPEIKGSIFFALNNIIRTSGSTPAGMATLIASNKLLREDWQRNMTIVPPMPWIDGVAPAAPAGVTRQGKTITWNDSDTNNSRYYVVYRISASSDGSGDPARVTADPSKIIARVYRAAGNIQTFTDEKVDYPNQYTYYVTAMNGAHVESAPAAVGQ